MMNDPIETNGEDELIEKLFLDKGYVNDDFILRKQLNEIQYDYFCFSTSKIEDDLSQWRSYTKQGLGVCIEIDIEELNKSISNTLFTKNQTSLECNYSEENKINAIENFISENNKELYPNHSNNSNVMSFELSIKFQELFLSFKHHSFATENEIRFFINKIQLSKEIDIEYKSNKYGITSFIPIKISSNVIKSIRIDSKVRKENIFNIMDLYFRKFGKSISIKSSECKMT
jgi:hypothetical protein